MNKRVVVIVVLAAVIGTALVWLFMGSKAEAPAPAAAIVEPAVPTVTPVVPTAPAAPTPEEKAAGAAAEAAEAAEAVKK